MSDCAILVNTLWIPVIYIDFGNRVRSFHFIVAQGGDIVDWKTFTCPGKAIFIFIKLKF